MTYKKILKAVKSKTISFDVAFDELSKLGYCPNLLNDDNGHWAVSFKVVFSLKLNVGKILFMMR